MGDAASHTVEEGHCVCLCVSHVDGALLQTRDGRQRYITVFLYPLWRGGKRVVRSTLP